MAYIGTLHEFQPRTNEWSIFKEKLEQFFIANKVATDEIKRAILLGHLSEEAYVLINSLCVPELPKTKTYEALTKLFDTHFSPKRSLFAERCKFYNAHRANQESVADWAARVKNLASACDFSAVILKEAVRDRFVMGMGAGSIRDRLFEEKVAELTIDKAVELAVNKEQSRRHFEIPAIKQEDEVFKMRTSFQGNTSRLEPFKFRTTNSSVERGSQRQNWGSGQGRNFGHSLTREARDNTKTHRGEKKGCGVCGKNNHVTHECMYKNSKCFKCGKVGHFSYVCNSRVKNYTNYLKVDSEEMFNLRSCNNPILCDIKINRKKFSFELDTGASCSVISSDFKNKNFAGKKLLACNKYFATYNGEKLVPIGVVDVDVEYKGEIRSILLYVIAGNGPPLLGRDFYYAFRLTIHNLEEFQPKDIIGELSTTFSNIFSQKLGLFKHGTIHLNLRKDVQPKFFKARPLPFALRQRVESEISRLVKLNILEAVDYCDWGTPIVPIIKKNGSVRLCGDYKVTLNQFLEIDQYPLPRIEELFLKLQGGKTFSRLDLSQAYQQVALDKESQLLTTISTHKGLFKYTRLPFGIACAPAKFQKLMETLLDGIDGTACFIDDIIVTGKSEKEHCTNLKKVFKVLEDSGLTLEKSKCSFFSTSIQYLGHVIDYNGLHTCADKIDAIINAPRPINYQQLQSFLGFVNYYGRFIPSASILLAPLYDLLKKNSKYHWSEACEKAFNGVKQILSEKPVLCHFNPKLPVKLCVDASPYGVGAVLSHVFSKTDERPIAFASKKLSDTQCNYSQIEKEALAIIFGVQKFYQFLYGIKFTLVTDHKPLVALFGSKKGIPLLSAGRLQRWALILSNFSYEIEYVKSSDNNADFFSRMPQSEVLQDDNWDTVNLNFVQDNRELPINIDQVISETQKDTVLKVVAEYIKIGWPKQIKNDLKAYVPYKNDLSLEKGCVMLGHKVLIPKTLQQYVLNELHSSHMGIIKTKSLARSYVWWPGLSKDIESMVNGCTVCAVTRNNPNKAKLIPWTFPDRAWDRVHVDYLGPFQGRYIFVLVDAYSKWIEAVVLNNCTSTTTINVLRSIFARFGFPKLLVSDNGRQFVSDEFQMFLSRNGIKFKSSPVCHPATNGAAENSVKTIKYALKKQLQQKDVGDMNLILNRFLLAYRNTQHCSTGESPANLFLGRNLRTRLDLLRPERRVDGLSEVKERMIKVHKKQVDNYKGRRCRTYDVGEKVLVRDYRMVGKPAWIKAIIIKVLGTRTYLVDVPQLGKHWRRHLNQIIDFVQFHVKDGASACDSTFVNPTESSECDIVPQVTETESYVTRSGRPVTIPERLQY